MGSVCLVWWCNIRFLSLRGNNSGNPKARMVEGRDGGLWAVGAQKSYGLECRQRLVMLLAGLLAVEEPRPATTNSSNGTSTGNGSSGRSNSRSVPPFISPPEAGSSSTPSEGVLEQKGDTSARRGRSEEGLHATAAVAPAAANPPAVASAPRDGVRPGGLCGVDRVRNVALPPSYAVGGRFIICYSKGNGPLPA